MNRTSTVLTGLALATGVARDAADGVPIVKQVLGLASRIVGLAELIDKNREDLHALADRAKCMDATITAIVADRELGEDMVRRLEDMNRVLRAVENRFVTHMKQGRLRKTLGYIFTVRKDIDRLRGEFDDRLKELEVAATLDATIIARENSRFIGEFRRIRHCEITLLRPITTVQPNKGDVIRCHIATCEGSSKVFVFRTVKSSRYEDDRRRIEDRLRILEQVSLIQNRHPVIACLYGRNIGPKDNRFVVLDAGDVLPFREAVRLRSADITVLGRMAANLADASCHLRKYGAAWRTRYAQIYVDSNYRPTIGIDNDLVPIGEDLEYHTLCFSRLLGQILSHSKAKAHPYENYFPHSHYRTTAWSKQILGGLIDAGYRTIRRENTVRRADLASLIPFTQESLASLRRDNDTYGCVWPDWGFVLLNMAMGRRDCQGSLMGAWHMADLSNGQDQLLAVYCVEGDADVVHHSETRVVIPHSADAEVRQRLGIPYSYDEEWWKIRGRRMGSSTTVFYLQHRAWHGDSSSKCSGWVNWSNHWALW